MSDVVIMEDRYKMIDSTETPPDFNFKIYKSLIIRDYKRRAMKQKGLDLSVQIKAKIIRKVQYKK